MAPVHSSLGPLMGGPPCRMSIIRSGNVALSNLRKTSCRPVDFKKVSCRPVDYKKVSCRPVDFKKVLCRMSLRPRKGRVAVSILRVRGPQPLPSLIMSGYIMWPE